MDVVVDSDRIPSANEVKVLQATAFATLVRQPCRRRAASLAVSVETPMPRVRHRRTSSNSSIDCPLPLRRVIRAALRERPAGHSETLRDIIDMALQKMPARGIFDPAAAGEHELIRGDRRDRQGAFILHALAAWQKAINPANLALTQRDNIEVAAAEVRHISDSAYYYAGLAFGLVFASRSTL